MGADGPTTEEPIVLLATGGAPDGTTALPRRLPAGSVVVAADAGLARLHAAGIDAHHLVGDLDSVDPQSWSPTRSSAAPPCTATRPTRTPRTSSSPST
ncbi:MAG: hypothetical protein R2711_10095 [Acidimicrobiales bacterium]